MNENPGRYSYIREEIAVCLYYIIEKNSQGVKNLRTPVGKNSGAYERTVCLGSVLNLIARW